MIDPFRGTPVTSGTVRGMSGHPMLAYGGLAFIIAAVWLVNSLTTADDAMRRGGAYRFGLPMFFEGTSAIVTLALLPLMRRGVALVRAGGSWPTMAARAGIVGALFAFAHIFGMVALRKLVYLGMGLNYEFNFPTEVPYEFRKDIVSALLIGLAFWFLDRPVSAIEPIGEGIEPRHPGDAKTPNPILWLRDGAARIRIDAREVVWVASAGNYVEFSLAVKRHLVRGTLAAEEPRLLPFGLVRVHRTRLVNLNHAVAVEPRPSGDFALRMDTGETLVGSRRYKEAVARLRGSEVLGAGFR
jgi:LytTr DNA-binding domain